MVEEDIVAVAVAVKVVKEIVGTNLQVVSQAVKVSEAAELKVEFDKANQRLVGDIKFNTAVATDDNALEAGRRDVGSVVEVSETNDLHVGMANGAARAGAVVFEKHDRGEFSAGDHVQPILNAEADDPLEVILGIERQFRCAVIGFDEDGLEGVLEHRVFVSNEEYRSIFGDDALKFVAATEGAFMASIDNGHRLSAANLGIKNKVVLL